MKKPALAIAPVLSALLLAGCGDDASEDVSGPAGVMPADMPIYFEVAIRPEGEQADNLDAFLAELGELPLIGSVGDPGDLAIEQIENQAASAGVDFSYADDIAPWLGERVGVAVTPEPEGEEIVVAAFEVSDEDQARESIEGLLEQGSTELSEDEYEGVSYLTDPSGEFSFGVFDEHAVFATPNAFESAVDASQGDSLGSADKLAGALESLGDPGLASLYLDLARFEELAGDPEDAENFAQAQAIVPELFEGAVAIEAGLSAGDQIYLDYSTPLIEGQPEAGSSELLGTAPGDALGAFAIEDIGAFVAPIVDLLERANEEGADLEDFPEEGIAQAFEDETGIALDDAAAAMGDLSLWVRGDLPSEDDADGTLEVSGEIEAADPEVVGDLIVRAEQEADENGEAKVGPPVNGADVGFSVLDDGPEAEPVPVEPIGPGVDPPDAEFDGDFDELAPELDSGSHDLAFFNIELDEDVIRYGFFRDQEAAEASDPDGAGDFSETDAYASGEEAIGDDFAYLGAIDLQPIAEALVPDPGIEDAILGPAELVAPFIADKLGVVAFGQRYEDGTSVSRYVLRLAE